MSKKYRLTQSNVPRIAKVMAWSVVSAVLVALIDVLPQVEFPAHVAFLVPVMNTGLYAALEFVRERKD